MKPPDKKALPSSRAPLELSLAPLPPPAPSRPGFPLRLPADFGTPSARKNTTLRAAFMPSLANSKRPINTQATATSITQQTKTPNLSQSGAAPYQAMRARMVQNLMAQGVIDARVLAAMGAIERHRFVDTALANQGYEDTSLPIGLGQTISKPNVVARMLELLVQGCSGKLGRVLEIGTGCGYQAALLGQLASEVYSMERLRGLHDKARENLRDFRLPNVHLIFGDGMLAYPRGAPYAAIIAAAGGATLPAAWTDQLAIGGRLVAPLETSPGVQALVVIDKTTNGLKHSVLEAVKFVPLKSGIS
jgi:protein-L-isoaspartate(D-aspartate) O-methyltransferase